MKLRLRVNLCAGIFAVLFSIALWILIPYQITVKKTNLTAAVDADYFPRLVAVVMLVIGILLILQSLVLKKDRLVEVDLKAEARVAVFLGIVIAYALLIPRLGFLISSVLAVCASLALFRCKNRKYYLIMVLLAAVVFAAFKFGLNVSLP